MSKNPDQAKREELAKRQKMTGAEKLAEYEATMGSRGRLKELNKTLSCSADLSKKILIGMNVFFLLFAVIILGVGAYAIGADNPIYSEMSAIPTGIMVLGGFVLFMSFLGCFGAMQENRILLLLYAILLGIALIIEFVLACIVLADRSKVDNILISTWNTSSAEVRREVQADFDCCGLQFFNDTNTTSTPAPCPSDATQPCLSVLDSSIQSRLSVLGGFVLTFAIIQLLGVVFALILRAGILGTYTFQ